MSCIEYGSERVAQLVGKEGEEFILEDGNALRIAEPQVSEGTAAAQADLLVLEIRHIAPEGGSLILVDRQRPHLCLLHIHRAHSGATWHGAAGMLVVLWRLGNHHLGREQ